MRRALYFTKAADGALRCGLCPHECAVAPGKTGICRARKNEGGELISLSYGTATAVHLDPVEKKPLYHFHPGSVILSVGAFGCNFRCSFCQNWEISQGGPETATERLSPEQALRRARASGSVGIAFTYNEPLVNYEWVKETAVLFRRHGLKNVLVTNGFIANGPLEELAPFIDAANVDVKAFNDDFYRDLCGARLAPVLESVETMVRLGIHVEITTLLVPGRNDSAGEVRSLAQWVSERSPDIPLHLSRYFPQYRFTAPPTGRETLLAAHAAAREKLRYVYLGNVDEPGYAATFCPDCRAPLVERRGYAAEIRELEEDRCRRCGATIALLR